MPDASIVVKATDRYSEAMKKMASVTKSFSKDVDALEDTLYALNKNKITLKMYLSKAKSELKAAEKQFDLQGRKSIEKPEGHRYQRSYCDRSQRHRRYGQGAGTQLRH